MYASTISFRKYKPSEWDYLPQAILASISWQICDDLSRTRPEVARVLLE